MSILEISKYNNSCAVLGSLKEGERLHTCWGRVSKYGATDRFLKGAESPIMQVVHRIVMLVIKLIQTIERFIFRQSTSLNLKKVQNLSKKILKTLDKDLPKTASKESYAALEQLGYVQASLKKAVTHGLKKLKITAHLKESKVQEAIDKISDEVLPKLGEKIAEIEAQLLKEDSSTVHQLIKQVCGDEQVDTDVVFSKAVAEKKLGDKYGKKAVARAFQFYRLENKLSLTGTDFVALMTGTVANLTAEDFPNFGSMSTGDLCKALEEIRDIQYNKIEPSKEMPYRKQLQHDQTVLNYIKEVDDYRATSTDISSRTLKHFSHSEYLSRQISYALFDQSNVRFTEGLLFPIYDKNDDLCLVQAHQLVSHEGIHGALIKPAKPKASRNKYQIVFRGTYCKESLMRDFSPNERLFTSFFDGPGRRSFEIYRNQIVHRMKPHLKNADKPILEFMGHSLGAVDAMRMMEYYMHLEALKEKSPIHAFNLFAYNTPSLEPDITRRFIESAHVLGSPIRLRYFNVHHDPIQQVGSHRLGYYRSDQEKPENVKISIFKFNRNFEERIRALTKNFFSRSKFILSKALEAHTFYCLKRHDTENPEELNTTFIQDIFTNHDKDAGIQYGRDLNEISSKNTEDEMGDELVTPFCLVGRKINRFVKRVENVFTFRRSTSNDNFVYC